MVTFLDNRRGAARSQWADSKWFALSKGLIGLLFVVLLIPFSTAHSQGLDTLKAISTFNGHRMPFTVLSTKPDSVGISGMAVILFLHGAGERGSDNNAQLTVALPKLVKSLEAIHEEHFLILAPQCPVDQKWVDTDWTLPSHKMKPEISPVLANVLHVLDSVIQSRPAIDPNCQYVTGISMGGFGTWELIQRFPQRFAAAIPVCGGGDTTLAAQLVNMPIWAFHGKKDKLVIPARTTDMISAITKRGGHPKQTLFDNLGHLCWDSVYKDPNVVRWLFCNLRNEQ